MHTAQSFPWVVVYILFHYFLFLSFFMWNLGLKEDKNLIYDPCFCSEGVIPCFLIEGMQSVA